MKHVHRRRVERIALSDQPAGALGLAFVAFLLAALCYVPDAIREQPECVVASCRNISVPRSPRVEVQCSDGRDLTIGRTEGLWPWPCYRPNTVLEKRLGEPSYRVDGQFSVGAGSTVVALALLALSIGLVSVAIFGGGRRKGRPRPKHHHG